MHEQEAFGGGSGRRLYCRLTSLRRSLQTILRINLDGTPTLVKSRCGADADKVRPSGQKEKRQASCDACRFSWYARLDSNQRPTESELSGCQAANRCGTMVWWVLHKFAEFYEKTSEAWRHKASEVFRSSSQIVVWIKCGFSSPVQLNIFTLYPWIRSAASHPSTLARSSTIPACAFASSYCFCS